MSLFFSRSVLYALAPILDTVIINSMGQLEFLLRVGYMLWIIYLRRVSHAWFSTNLGRGPINQMVLESCFIDIMGEIKHYCSLIEQEIFEPLILLETLCDLREDAWHNKSF